MNCPSCWRPIDFEEKYLKVVSCPYCNSVLEYWSGELTKIWQQGDFIDFPSDFVVWKTTTWQWKDLYVKWQLRYEYDWWFFDKFFSVIDGEKFYLQEDDWQRFLLKNWSWTDSEETLIDKSPWETYSLLWKEVFVQEVWIHSLSSIKWYIDDILIPWKEYEYLNWIIDWEIIHFEKEVWKDRILEIREVKL